MASVTINSSLMKMTPKKVNGAFHPTKFSNMNHPTYQKDLEIVSKMMPVSSYQSISTMGSGNSDDSESTSGMSIPMMNDDVTMFDRAKTLDIQQREATVKAYGNGEAYKLEKLKLLEEKRLIKLNQMERKLLKHDPIKENDFWAHFDYDSFDLSADDYDLKHRIFTPSHVDPSLKQYTIEKNDKWAHLDYDSGDFENSNQQRVFVH